MSSSVRTRFSENETVTPEALRRTLGDNLYLIRFPIMTGQQFVDGPEKSGILSNEVVQSSPSLCTHATEH